MTAFEFNDQIIKITVNLRPYALNLTKDLDDANDLIQETMYRALTNREKYTAGTNLKAWLFTIMKNIFINGYRKKVKRKTILDTTDNDYYINSAQSVIKNESESSFVMEDITRAISNLADEFRVPFMMHYRGFKYQEIADELDLPLGTVKSRIFFARKELKDNLRTYRIER